MILNNKVYDVMKEIVQLWLPALGTFYFTVAAIWGLPAAEQVVGTIVAIATLLGTLLKLSNANYTPNYDGVINVERDNGKLLYDLVVEGDVYDIPNRDAVLLKVRDPEQEQYWDH